MSSGTWWIILTGVLHSVVFCCCGPSASEFDVLFVQVCSSTYFGCSGHLSYFFTSYEAVWPFSSEIWHQQANIIQISLIKHLSSSFCCSLWTTAHYPIHVYMIKHTEFVPCDSLIHFQCDCIISMPICLVLFLLQDEFLHTALHKNSREQGQKCKVSCNRHPAHGRWKYI